jgi:hypothetical protein
VSALACHGELARLRPRAEHLTEFYFWLALGGALGGALTALLARCCSIASSSTRSRWSRPACCVRSSRPKPAVGPWNSRYRSRSAR